MLGGGGGRVGRTPTRPHNKTHDNNTLNVTNRNKRGLFYEWINEHLTFESIWGSSDKLFNVAFDKTSV